MDSYEVEKLFSKHSEDDFLAFDKIPVANRRHPRKDICAMIYMHERCGGDHKMLTHAEHDQVWFDPEMDNITVTDDDALYLTRCGVMFDNGFSMFV